MMASPQRWKQLLAVPAVLLALALFALIRIATTPSDSKTRPDGGRVSVPPDEPSHSPNEGSAKREQLVLEAIDAEGAPVSAAHVSDSLTGEFAGATDTRGRLILYRGRLRFDGLGIARLIVSHTEHAPCRVEISRDASRVRAVLSRGGTLQLRVRDIAANPIAGAFVRVASVRPGPWESNRPREYRCDESGALRLATLPMGIMDLRVWADGCGAERRRVMFAPGQIADVVVTLGPGKQLNVRVQDPSQRPVSDATIRVEYESQDLLLTESTDSNGLAVFTGIPSGAEEVAVRGSHASHLSKEIIQVLDGAPVTECTLVLKQASSLLVTVTDEAGRAVDAAVQVREGTGSLFSTVKWVEVSGGTAHAVGPLPPSVTLVVTVAQDGATVLEQSDIMLAPGEQRRIDLRVPLTVEYTVRVRDEDGRPVSGRARLESREGKTTASSKHLDEDGRPFPLGYTRAVLDNGECHFCVQPGLYELIVTTSTEETAKQAVQITSKGDTTVVVSRGRFLRGQVRDGDGKHAAGVHLVWLQDDAVRRGVSDADGRFAILTKGEPGELFAADGYGGLQLLFRGVAPLDDLPALTYERVRISGTLVDTKSGQGVQTTLRVRPVSNEYADLSSYVRGRLAGETDGFPESFAVVGPDGRFEIDIPPGSWQLEAKGERVSGKAVDLHAVPGSRSMTVVVQVLLREVPAPPPK